MLRLTVLLFGIATLAAQESTSAIPHNEKVLQNAIAGLGKKPVRPAPQRMRIDAPAACSVGLQAMPMKNPDQFTMRSVPTADVAPMPQVVVSAPACETATR